jgi:hypothetical protein
MTAIQQWWHGTAAALTAAGVASYLDEYGLNQVIDRGVFTASAFPGVFDFAPNPGLNYTDNTDAAIVGSGDASYWAMSPTTNVEIVMDPLVPNPATNNLIFYARVPWPVGTTPPNMQFLAYDPVGISGYYVNLYFASNTTAEITVYDTDDEFVTIIPVVNITRNGDYLEFKVQLTGLTVYVIDEVAGAYDATQSPWLGTGSYAAHNLTLFQVTGTTNGRLQLAGLWIVTP